MTPLQLKILAGTADNELLRVIDDLDRMRRTGGLSPGEEDTWFMAWVRLDELTEPRGSARG